MKSIYVRIVRQRHDTYPGHNDERKREEDKCEKIEKWFCSLYLELFLSLLHGDYIVCGFMPCNCLIKERDTLPTGRTMRCTCKRTNEGKKGIKLIYSTLNLWQTNYLSYSKK